MDADFYDMCVFLLLMVREFSLDLLLMFIYYGTFHWFSCLLSYKVSC